MKYILFLITTLLLVCVSCDDYVEKDIEGQWQMTKIIRADDTVEKVDTVFFSFKKGVFRYLRSETDISSFWAYGNYSRSGESLWIKVDESTFAPSDCIQCLGWDQLERTYTVTKRNSSDLELKYNGDLFVFRKY